MPAATLGYFQPTFLYELLWDVARRRRAAAASTGGCGSAAATSWRSTSWATRSARVWIEALRTDHANHILGVRLNVWTSIIVFLLGLAYFLRHGGFRAEREASPYPAGRREQGEPDSAESSTETESTTS